MSRPPAREPPPARASATRLLRAVLTVHPQSAPKVSEYELAPLLFAQLRARPYPSGAPRDTLANSAVLADLIDARHVDPNHVFALVKFVLGARGFHHRVRDAALRELALEDALILEDAPSREDVLILEDAPSQTQTKKGDAFRVNDGGVDAVQAGSGLREGGEHAALRFETSWRYTALTNGDAPAHDDGVPGNLRDEADAALAAEALDALADGTARCCALSTTSAEEVAVEFPPS